MLMMLGLAVDTGSTVVERPATDAHDAWWLSTLACRGQAVCR